MTKKYTLLLFVWLTSHVLYSQILKVDKGNLDADSSGYFMGSVDASFNINNRSTTAEEEVIFKGLNGNADLVYVSDKHAYILINSINYFTSTGGPLISTGYAHFRVNLLRKKTLSYELFTQIQYDDGRNMPFRFLQGGGIRINLAESSNSSLHLGLGIMHEEEHWKSIRMDGQIIEKEIWKTSDYISGKIKVNDYVNFSIITYYQGGYDNESEVFRNRVSGDAVLSVKITDRLAFLTSFSAQYEDKPIIPINGFVYSLTNGLKFNF
ncbi:DUF481 domain-containing protein [Fulvivirga sp. RKSG066]|uniref:DUF481 domain-containing protein n=1 Tax=Fulvivirga aurantia TaxID=2529383 RepID=UPI0012BC6AA4|nr:DUF481 domain-containing protein [Fulvivirga aurantia]MTI22475.1 DUF481 domain-containing protein [Fulvivirga aurantia]